jgi:spermidine/putrescine-binding protein
MRKLLITLFLLISCGKGNVEVWYSLGEIHDYHFKRVINTVWKDFGFGIVLKSFSSQEEMDESLRVRQPDLALVYPKTLKNLIKSGKLMEFAEKEELPNYCGRYCYPMFKSVLGFYVTRNWQNRWAFQRGLRFKTF